MQAGRMAMGPGRVEVGEAKGEGRGNEEPGDSQQ